MIAHNLGAERGLPAILRLQDVQILQGVHEPALLARRGAIVVNLFPVRAIITAQKAFIILPDGADGWLEPFLTTLRNPQVAVSLGFTVCLCLGCETRGSGEQS